MAVHFSSHVLQWNGNLATGLGIARAGSACWLLKHSRQKYFLHSLCHSVFQEILILTILNCPSVSKLIVFFAKRPVQHKVTLGSQQPMHLLEMA